MADIVETQAGVSVVFEALLEDFFYIFVGNERGRVAVVPMDRRFPSKRGPSTVRDEQVVFYGTAEDGARDAGPMGGGRGAAAKTPPDGNDNFVDSFRAAAGEGQPEDLPESEWWGRKSL
jgi:hypothetical protein